MTELPKCLIGGGTAGEWPQQNAAEVAKALAESGCNCTLIEAMAPVYDKGPTGYNSLTIEQVEAKVSAWITAMRARGIWTIVHLVNGGDETLTHFGLTKCKWMVEALARVCGVDRVVMVAAAEPKGEAGMSELSEYAERVWHDVHGGLLGWNGDARPAGVPNSKYCLLDYHTQNQGDFGPDPKPGMLVLLDTDNGPIINSLRGGGVPAGAYWDPLKVGAWAKACCGKGRSLNLYQFQTTIIDRGALAALAVAYNGKPTPLPLDPVVPVVPDPTPVPVPEKPKASWWARVREWWRSVRRKNGW